MWNNQNDFLRQKYNKDYEEDDQDGEYFYHKPSVGRDGLKIFYNFTVSSFDVQMGVVHVGVDSEKWVKITLHKIGQNWKSWRTERFEKIPTTE